MYVLQQWSTVSGAAGIDIHISGILSAGITVCFSSYY